MTTTRRPRTSLPAPKATPPAVARTVVPAPTRARRREPSGLPCGGETHVLSRPLGPKPEPLASVNSVRPIWTARRYSRRSLSGPRPSTSQSSSGMLMGGQAPCPCRTEAPLCGYGERCWESWHWLLSSSWSLIGVGDPPTAPRGLLTSTSPTAQVLAMTVNGMVPSRVVEPQAAEAARPLRHLRSVRGQATLVSRLGPLRAAPAAFAVRLNRCFWRRQDTPLAGVGLLAHVVGPPHDPAVR